MRDEWSWSGEGSGARLALLGVCSQSRGGGLPCQGVGGERVKCFTKYSRLGFYFIFFSRLIFKLIIVYGR